MKETMKQAGYQHIETRLDGQHILEEIKTGNREVWISNRNHANYGIIYKNTHLEFAYSLPK